MANENERAWQPHLGPHVVDPSSRTSVSIQSNTEEGDGSLWSHLHGSVYKLSKDCARRRYSDAKVRVGVFHLRSVECLRNSLSEARARYESLRKQPLPQVEEQSVALVQEGNREPKE